VGVRVEVAEEHDFVVVVKGVLEGERVVDSHLFLLLFLVLIAIFNGIQLNNKLLTITSLNGTYVEWVLFF
jgi:hypothetical protein